MKATDYSSKINELLTIKERRKLIREIQESKKRLLYDKPEPIIPFLREKVSDTILREIRHHSPLVPDKDVVVRSHNSGSRDREYLAMMREQRSMIERELQNLRLVEQTNRRDLEQRMAQLIESQGASNSASVAEIRAMLRSFTATQADLNRPSPSSNPMVRDLQILKTNYLLDGGQDPQLLMEIDSAIMAAEKNKMNQLNNDDNYNNNWTRRRRDLALAQEKSYELRDLERQNAELERQLDMSQARSEFRSERNIKSVEKKGENEKIENLQKQIEELKMHIDNLKKPENVEPSFNTMNRPISRVTGKQTSNGAETRNIVILIDFITGIGQHIRSVSVTLSLYHGPDKIGSSLVVEAISVSHKDKLDPDSSALINIKHPVINCPCSADVFALLELRFTMEYGNEHSAEAWAKINLFNDHDEVKLGNWKESILSDPIHMNCTIEELSRLPRYHRAVLHYRLAYYSSDEVFRTGMTSGNYEEPPNKYIKTNPFMMTHSMQNIDAESDGDKSDITMDLDERPEFGFQIIRIKNIAIGDGLDLAKVRMTVYHTEGSKKGQILMSNEGPVTCSTSAVRSDFKISCYNFGDQVARFTQADLSVDCLVYARFYLEGEARLTDNGEAMAKEEVLVAWTAMSVVKRRTIARRNPSYFTDSLKLLKINKGLHDIPLYEPPALLPSSVVFDHNRHIMGQKIIGRSKLKFRLFHTQLVYDSATSNSTSMDDNYEIGKEPAKAWIPVDRTEPSLLPYHQSEGFDLYIDSGRLFPDSATIVKVEGSIVDRHLCNQGPQLSAITSLSSDIYNPIFNERLEVREPHLTPSSTLLLKVMTFDREDKNQVVLGYASLKLFVETGSDRQPHFDNLGVLVSLNDGGHQLRIYLTEPTINDGPFTESWFNTHKTRSIPGASMLVRLYKPPKNSEGRSININDVPIGQRARLGVTVEAPEYNDGYYYSMSCKPTDGENKIMMRHLSRSKVLLRDLMLSKWSERWSGALSLGDELDNSHLFKLFNVSNKDLFDFNRIAHYVPTNGFKISIDGALNLPWYGYPMGHICLYPPGALYMKKPLMAYDRPYIVSRLDFLSTQSSPIWTDGWKSYRRRKYDRNLVAIFHLHEMKISVVKNEYVLTLENQAWTPIKIFDGPYCVTKSTQMPLITGAPTLALLQDLTTKPLQQFLLDNVPTKKIVPLQNSSVIVRQCDSRRQMEIAMSAEDELLTLDQSYLPQANITAYRTIFQSTNDVQFSSTIPVGFTVETFQEFLNVKFKSLVYKLYEQNGFFLNSEPDKKI